MPNPISPINSINYTVREFLVPQVSPVVHLFFRALKIYHQCWWVYQRQKRYRDTKNWVYLGAGVLINSTIGNFEPIKRGLQIYTIALRIYYVVKELEHLQKAWADVVSSVKNDFHQLPSTSKKRPESFFKPYKVQAVRIRQATAHLFLTLANVSARCIDVYDAFYMENNQEIFTDIVNGIREFRERKVSSDSHLLKIVNKIAPLISKTIKPKDVMDSVNWVFSDTTRIAQILMQCKGKARIMVSVLAGAYQKTTGLFKSLVAPAQPLLIENPSNK